MGRSNGVPSMKGSAHRGDAESAEETRSLHWLDPAQTGFAVDCGGCGVAHFVLNVAPPSSQDARQGARRAGLGSHVSGLNRAYDDA
jgi:hypothetical protein